ncbi:MAG: DNA polymerase I [Gammaproteobacteria bacterium]|nr:DNA polymerase I [Gammaproteobacteria bacterium]
MSDSDQSPVILVDGSSYLYRAFHVPELQSLITSSGQPTGAVYGVVNMIKRLLGKEQPSHIAVVFDAKGKTFRHELYTEYKANRPPMPDELRTQIDPLHSVIRALGLVLLSEPNVEADDVIGTLASQAVEQGREVLISTGDKDMAQLVNEHVTLVNTMTNTKMDASGVMKKFGVTPHQIIDYLALTGDKSDNIPGVPGVGPKTAAKWLNEYGSLEEIVSHADSITGKIGEKLRAHIAQLPLSHDLASIRCALELPVDIDDLRVQSPDIGQLKTLYTELEFKSWMSSLATHESDPMPVAPDEAIADTTSYELILNEEDLDRWLASVQNADLVAMHAQTDCPDYMRAEVVGLSLSVSPGEAAYIPFAHHYPDVPEQLDRNTTLKRLEPILNSTPPKVIGHNLKHDRSVLLNYGIHLEGVRHDIMLQSYVSNSVASRHDLNSLCKKYLDRTNVDITDIIGKGAKRIAFDQVALDDATEFVSGSADMALRLHKMFWSELQQPQKSRLKSLYEEVELPMLKVLSNMERQGVLLDSRQLTKQSQQLDERIQEIEAQAFELAGEEFNLGSPKQIQEVLFERQGLPVRRKTPTGQPSTAEDVLQELARDFPLPKLLLEHRALSKLKSTYTDKLPGLINPVTGRIHTSYHQAVAATGRLSSSDPNLQNIPIRTEEGRRIRQAFVAPESHTILAADYSQIELRIMAHLSQDERLCDAFSKGEDIHRATAAEVFACSLEAVGPEQRRAAKAINFGLIYGMSAFGLAAQLGISRSEAQQYVRLYFDRYPGVKKYMGDIREQARTQGYVETLFGRRLYLPDINHKNVKLRQYAERTAINAPMQGTAADIIKRAMIQIDAWLEQENPGCKMIMQVHDELVFEVHREYMDVVCESVKRKMSAAAELSVPLVVDAAYGNNWDEAH